MNVSRNRVTDGKISVELRSPGLDLLDPWNELASRLDANVFMHPLALNAATETGFAEIHVLVAWEEGASPRRPVGFWALGRRRNFPLTRAFLETLPYEYAFTSNAVIDPAYVEEVVAAFFEAIRSSPRLPKTISLRSFEADAVVHPAMLRCLESAGRYRETLRWERPFADLSSGTRKTGKNSKKRQQDWSRLNAIGPTEIVHDRTAQGVTAALEIFLALELASWKGEQGTALLCKANHARFVRWLIGDLAAQELASVALLCVSGKPIAAQVMLHCGRLAYMWKPTHDRNYARYSPGALLCARVTDDLLQSGQATLIDSCSSPNSFMAQLWTGRRTMVDALLDIGPRSLLTFWIEIAHHRGYQLASLARDRFRAAITKPRPQKVTESTAAAVATKRAAVDAVAKSERTRD